MVLSPTLLTNGATIFMGHLLNHTGGTVSSTPSCHADSRIVWHCRMVSDGAQPNTKTFTALIGSFGKLGSVRAALDIIGELLSHEPGGVGSPATYAALMAACEKAGQGDLALALFQKMAAQVRASLRVYSAAKALCRHRHAS